MIALADQAEVPGRERPAGSVSLISRGSSTLPRLTPRMPPQPISISCCSSKTSTSRPAAGPSSDGDLGHAGRGQRRRRAVGQVAADGRRPGDRLAARDARPHLVGDRLRGDDRQRRERRLVAASADEEAPAGEQHALDDDLREVAGRDCDVAVGELDRERLCCGTARANSAARSRMGRGRPWRRRRSRARPGPGRPRRGPPGSARLPVNPATARWRRRRRGRAGARRPPRRVRRGPRPPPPGNSRHDRDRHRIAWSTARGRSCRELGCSAISLPSRGRARVPRAPDRQ